MSVLILSCSLNPESHSRLMEELNALSSYQPQGD